MTKVTKIIQQAAEYEEVLRRPGLSQADRKKFTQALAQKRLEVLLRKSLSPLPSGHPMQTERSQSPPTIVFFHVDVGGKHPFLRPAAGASVDYEGVLAAAIAQAS